MLTFCSPAPVQRAKRHTQRQYFGPADERAQIKCNGDGNSRSACQQPPNMPRTKPHLSFCQNTFCQFVKMNTAPLSALNQTHQENLWGLTGCSHAFVPHAQQPHRRVSNLTALVRAQIKRSGKGNLRSAPPHQSSMRTHKHHVSKPSRPVERAQIKRTREMGGNSRRTAPPHASNMPAEKPREHFGPTERAQIKRSGKGNLRSDPTHSHASQPDPHVSILSQERP